MLPISCVLSFCLYIAPGIKKKLKNNTNTLQEIWFLLLLNNCILLISNVVWIVFEHHIYHMILISVEILQARLSVILNILKVYVKYTLFSMLTFLQISRFRKVYLKYTFPIEV